MGKSVPAVMFIEMAMDALKNEDAAFVAREVHEFDSLGDARKAEVVAACGGDPMTAGYLLGLETARVELATMPAAVFNKIEL